MNRDRIPSGSSQKSNNKATTTDKSAEQTDNVSTNATSFPEVADRTKSGNEATKAVEPIKDVNTAENQLEQDKTAEKQADVTSANTITKKPKNAGRKHKFRQYKWWNGKGGQRKASQTKENKVQDAADPNDSGKPEQTKATTSPSAPVAEKLDTALTAATNTTAAPAA